jgi:hypothetical protein
MTRIVSIGPAQHWLRGATGRPLPVSVPSVLRTSRLSRVRGEKAPAVAQPLHAASRLEGACLPGKAVSRQHDQGPRSAPAVNRASMITTKPPSVGRAKTGAAHGFSVSTIVGVERSGRGGKTHQGCHASRSFDFRPRRRFPASCPFPWRGIGRIRAKPAPVVARTPAWGPSKTRVRELIRLQPPPIIQRVVASTHPQAEEASVCACGRSPDGSRDARSDRAYGIS